jgi:hypothetical protein
MTKTQTAAKTETSRFANSPAWVAQKEDAKHRETIRASVSLEADDDWLDAVEAE